VPITVRSEHLALVAKKKKDRAIPLRDATA
jgi:hypothetical protein